MVSNKKLLFALYELNRHKEKILKKDLEELVKYMYKKNNVELVPTIFSQKRRRFGKTKYTPQFFIDEILEDLKKSGYIILEKDYLMIEQKLIDKVYELT